MGARNEHIPTRDRRHRPGDGNAARRCLRRRALRLPLVRSERRKPPLEQLSLERPTLRVTANGAGSMRYRGRCEYLGVRVSEALAIGRWGFAVPGFPEGGAGLKSLHFKCLLTRPGTFAS